jgi:hypothetical protein
MWNLEKCQTHTFCVLEKIMWTFVNSPNFMIFYIFFNHSLKAIKDYGKIQSAPKKLEK